jgi:hypothetical protein
MPLHGHALYEQIIVKGGENCESPMDRHMCLSRLRVLAKSNRPDRGALVERHNLECTRCDALILGIVDPADNTLLLSEESAWRKLPVVEKGGTETQKVSGGE